MLNVAFLRPLTCFVTVTTDVGNVWNNAFSHLISFRVSRNRHSANSISKLTSPSHNTNVSSLHNPDDESSWVVLHSSSTQLPLRNAHKASAIRCMALFWTLHWQMQKNSIMLCVCVYVLWNCGKTSMNYITENNDQHYMLSPMRVFFQQKPWLPDIELLITTISSCCGCKIGFTTSEMETCIHQTKSRSGLCANSAWNTAYDWTRRRARQSAAGLVH